MGSPGPARNAATKAAATILDECNLVMVSLIGSSFGWRAALPPALRSSGWLAIVDEAIMAPRRFIRMSRRRSDCFNCFSGRAKSAPDCSGGLVEAKPSAPRDEIGDARDL